MTSTRQDQARPVEGSVAYAARSTARQSVVGFA